MDILPPCREAGPGFGPKMAGFGAVAAGEVSPGSKTPPGPPEPPDGALGAPKGPKKPPGGMGPLGPHGAHVGPRPGNGSRDPKS